LRLEEPAVTAMTTDTLYDVDFVTWTERQAEELRRLAREGSNLPLDWENLAEEIESLGKRDRRSLYRRVYQILRHLLKLKYSPAEEPRHGWMGEVGEQRQRLKQLLGDSPSLKPLIDDAIADQWRAAVQRAEFDLREHGENVPLSHLAAAPLLSADEVLSDWYPESEA
jgi:hypothetical protein